jgi:hypothetical protein
MRPFLFYKFKIRKEEVQLKNTLSVKFNTGVVLEYPPEADKYPIWVQVPAKQVVNIYYLRDKDGNDIPQETVELVPDKNHPDFATAVREGVKKETTRVKKLWQEWEE